jgi:surface protein
MKGVFSYRSNFNEDISRWNVRNVTDMSLMFAAASQFDGDLQHWDVGNVTNTV